MNKTTTVSKPSSLHPDPGSYDDCHLVRLDGDAYVKISNSHLLPEFMMTLTSSSNHWMFVSSHGALTAGRRNSNNALFPYYSSDKIVSTRKQTGPRTVIRLKSHSGPAAIWEPFADANPNTEWIQRNLYKSPLGNKLCFEETHSQFGLTFRYRWAFSHQFGIVRTARLINNGDQDWAVQLIDGIQNIVPYGVGESFQLQYGNLINAYKKSELTETGIGVYYLSSIPTDRAEPSEGLRATIAWTTRVPDAVLLSEQQVCGFIDGQDVATETDVRGRRGDYLLNFNFDLPARREMDWDIIADLEHDQTELIDLAAQIQSDQICEKVQQEVELCQSRLLELIAKTDGFQVSDRPGKSLRHQANVMFNVMRGGVPGNDYEICTKDLRRHVEIANREVATRSEALLQQLPDKINRNDMLSKIDAHADQHLKRIVMEYLPLVFSRRHGDPTRPWNKFSIESHLAAGNRSYAYQGNWRDIFQNWEALAYSYPQFVQGMICRFVNASTADGYNPYRVTKNGFEWESPEPENPWANIGYWCDHQIIYLCKLLELSNQFFPGQLDAMLNDRLFVYANVPYRIKPIDQILENPRETVEYDFELSAKLTSEAEQFGNDSKLLKDNQGNIHSASLAEKLLLTFLVKMSNFVPGGGIWLNTQRPEWNDANNALVGYGLSVVTVCYMRRYVGFLRNWLRQQDATSLSIQKEIAVFMNRIQVAISPHVVSEEISISPAQRHQIVMDLSLAGSKYRDRLYASGLSSEVEETSIDSIVVFFDQCCRLLDGTIFSNRRSDGLFHSYNLMSMDVEGEIQVERLYEMLEGQVAVLSSGLLSPQEAIEVLNALRQSALYREDQGSYMLYPNRELPRFTEKNVVTSGLINQSRLLQELLSNGDQSIIRKDIFGNCHFNGDFRNRADVEQAVESLRGSGEYDEFLEGAGDQIGNIFENVFCHHQFTGRSGTFFAYEGLGSIYWHMVSKLLLAVSEIYTAAEGANDDASVISSLKCHFRGIQRGLGAEKPPIEYGAFPSDPYSHTPEHAGAQQPGMTGQVKEDILSRFTEMGVRVADGKIRFSPSLLEREEFCQAVSELPTWNFGTNSVDVISVSERRFAFTFCGVPIQYFYSDTSELKVHYQDGKTECSGANELSAQQSQALFARNGSIRLIEVAFPSINPS